MHIQEDKQKLERMVHTFDLLFEKDKDVISTLQSKLYKENKTYLSEYPSILIYLSYLYENESVKLSSEKVLNQIVKYASLLVDAIKKNDQNNVSLCYGLTGIAYAFSYCHKKTGLFDNIVNTVEKSLVRLAQEEIHKIRGEKRQVMEADFDLLLGLGGCANYFLAKQVISREEEELLKQILLYFSILLENEGENARIQKDVMVMDYLRDEYPDGYISMGAAHGILAAIFALTQAYERTNKIEYLTALRKGISIYNSYIWETYDYYQKRIIYGFPDRADSAARIKCVKSKSWCYGSLGIARILYKIAKSIGNQALQEQYADIAKTTMYYKDKLTIRNTNAICHGEAGIMLLLDRMYQDTGDKAFYNESQKYFQRILNSADYNNSYIYREKDIYFRGLMYEDGYEYIDLGLLSGNTGIIIALLGHNTYEYGPLTQMFMM